MNSTQNRTPRVLLVDDDENFPQWFAHYSKRFGIQIEFVYACDMEEGVNRLNEVCFDAAVIDVILPGPTGAQLGWLLRQHDPHIPLAYLTNLDTEHVKEEARAHRALYLFKQAFIGEGDTGMLRLLRTIEELARLNPCLPGGVRVDSQGFQRQLSTTPLQMPDPFSIMLNHSKAMARAA